MEEPGYGWNHSFLRKVADWLCEHFPDLWTPRMVSWPDALLIRKPAQLRRQREAGEFSLV